MKKFILFTIISIFMFSCAGEKKITVEEHLAQKQLEQENYKDLKNKERKAKAKEELLGDYKEVDISKTLSEDISKYYVNSAFKEDPTKEKSLSYAEKHREEILNKNPIFTEDIDVTIDTSKSLNSILSTILKRYNLVLKVDNGVDLNYPLSINFSGTLYDFLDVLLSPLSYNFNYERPNKLYVKAFQTEVFKLKFLNMEHEYNLDFSTNSSGQTSQSSSDGQSITSGQAFQLKVVSKTDEIWKTIEEEINTLMSRDGRAKINKNSGTISVTDRVAFMVPIRGYVDTLNKIYSKQVFLDVTVVQVELNKNHQHGVDWGFLKTPIWDKWAIGSFSNLSPFSGLASAAPAMTNFTDVGMPLFTITNSQGFTEFMLGALKEFGDTEVKAHPKQLVLNKQPAVIPIGQIITYISDMTVDSNDYGGWGGNGNEYSTETSTLMDGVTLQFLPDIDDDDKISMNVGIILNKLVSMERVPLGSEGGYVQLPTVNNRADMTTIRMHSGDSVVIGGLIMDEKETNNRGIPLLMDIPYLGNLFKYKSESTKKTELIIILKARVLHI